MNNEDLICSALDNTLVPQGENAAKNSNTYGVQEGFSEVYTDRIDQEHDALFKQDDENLKQDDFRKTVLAAPYAEITLDQELRNCMKNCEEPDKKSQMAKDSSKRLSSAKVKHRDISSSASGDYDPNISAEFDVRIGHDGLQREDIEEDVMSGSYGEISLEKELLSPNKNSDSQSSKEDLKNYLSDENKSESLHEEITKESKRPDSLVLTQNLPASRIDEFASTSKDTAYTQQMHKSQQTSECRTSAEVSPSLSSEEFALHSMGHARTGSDTSGLSELQGTLTVDGDLVTFVAEDLQEKIKMSSPVSRVTDSSSFPGSRSSTPSLYRQALQPQFHIVDPHVISDLETHTKKVATVVDNMLENLSETLQSFSSLTVACMETYESSVCKTCDSVDANIKAVYQLMAKCEELSNSMQPLYGISGDLKHIKKMLDQLEHIVEHKS